jgi:hypothetical protein
MSLTAEEIVRARRVLDLMSPTAVVEWASNELAAGRDEPGLIKLAATYDPSAPEVDGLLDELLRALDRETPDDFLSVFYVSYAIARDIVDKRVGPSEGAHQIAAADRGRTKNPTILGLIGLADDWDDGLQTNWDGREGAQDRLEEQIHSSAVELVEDVENL